MVERAIACAAAALLSSAATAAEVSAERRAELERLVVQDCGSCHGMRLTGGLGAPITPAALAGRARSDIRTVIHDGLPGTAMPPWRPLISEADADWIAEAVVERLDVKRALYRRVDAVRKPGSVVSYSWTSLKRFAVARPLALGSGARLATSTHVPDEPSNSTKCTLV